MNIFQYLLQVNICLTLFYAFYTLLLRNETFFRLNRIYLISTALLSFVLPLLQSAWIRSLFVTEKVYQAKEAISYVLYPDTALMSIPAADPIDNSISLSVILSGLYILGCALLTMRFLYQLYLLKRTSAGHSAESKAYSFFNKIVVAHDVEEHSTIHKHEQVHVQEWHSADVLLFELMAIINWFNPVVYAYKKSVKSIHEYIADEKAATLQPNKEAYAMLLMSNVFGVQANQLTNSFHAPSLIKRRIVMLYKTKSRRIAVLKYGFSAPLFIIMLIFSSATLKADKIAAYSEKIEETAFKLPDFARTPDDTERSYSDFLKRNPAVRRVSWFGKPDWVYIHFKNGHITRYDLHSAEAMKIAIAKYGALPVAPPPPPKPRVSTIKFPPLITVPKENKLEKVLADTSKKPLYVIDGKVVDEKLVKALNPSSIESVAVNKGNELVSKYGPGAKSGIVEIKLKDVPDTDKLKEVIVTGYPAVANAIKDRSSVMFKKAPDDVLVVIDGQEHTGKWETISSKIPPEEIRSVTVLKDAAAAVYGEKGKDGVLIITTVRNKGNDEPVFTSAEVLPQPPGGEREWQSFLATYKIPEEAKKNNVSGRAVISFIVEKDGSLTNFKSVRDLGFGTTAAALELLKRSPKWKPGIQNGKPVRVVYSQVITIGGNK